MYRRERERYDEAMQGRKKRKKSKRKIFSLCLSASVSVSFLLFFTNKRNQVRSADFHYLADFLGGHRVANRIGKTRREVRRIAAVRVSLLHGLRESIVANNCFDEIERFVKALLASVARCSCHGRQRGVDGCFKATGIIYI